MSCSNTARHGREPVDARTVIKVTLTVTSDSPDGQPWPPPDSNTLWSVVRRSDGHTVWRAIQLAEVRFAAPDAILQRQQPQWRIST
jgi:hypothetical protein